MFPSLHLSVKDVEGDGKIIIIDTSNCWPTLCQKTKFKSIDVQKTSERPNADRERKTHILYFTKFFFPFPQNKGAGHTASEPRRRTSHYKDRHWRQRRQESPPGRNCCGSCYPFVTGMEVFLLPRYFWRNTNQVSWKIKKKHWYDQVCSVILSICTADSFKTSVFSWLPSFTNHVSSHLQLFPNNCSFS